MAGILESTVYLSVTAVIILLFKWIFKNKLSAKWHVWIWALLAIRLVLPSLPESSLSVFNAIEMPLESRGANTTQQMTEIVEPATEILQNETVMLDEFSEMKNEVVSVEKTENAVADTEVHLADEKRAEAQNGIAVEISHAESTVPEEKENASFDTETVVKTVRYSGAVLFFAYFAVIYAVCIVRLSKKPKLCDSKTAEMLKECKKKVGVRRKVSVICDGNSPMLAGLFKPVIVLPDGYSEKENRDIFIHELCHLKNGDIYILWIAMIVLCLNWYNPIMWICFFIFRRDIEVYCDERVLRYIDSKKDYAALLVKTALKKNSFIAGTTSLQNGEKEVERRVKYMAYFKKPHYTWTVIIVIIAVIIGVVCLTDPKRDVEKEAENDTENGVEKDEVGYDLPEDYIYNEFLENAISVKIDNVDYTLSEYVKRHNIHGMKMQYAFFDMNGDGVLEFHLKSPRSYDIFTVNDMGFELWYEGSPYENFTSDGNILYCRHGGAPNNETYIFKELDSDGNVVSEVSFSVYELDDRGSITSDSVFYNGDGEEISKDEYYDLKNKYDKVIYDYDWFVFYDNLKTVIWEYINEEKQTDTTIQYPAFYGMTDELLQDKINAKINQAVFELYLEMSELTDDFNQTTWPIEYTVEYISDRYISVVFNGYVYTMGAAHGTDYKYAVTVDLATGEKVKLSDIFDDSFVDYLTFENFGECIEIDFSGAFSKATDLIFTNIREEFERDRGNLFYDYFHFANDGFHITHAPQNAFFCFTADYESLKGCMKDHPIWQELGVKKGKVLQSTKNFYLEEISPTEYCYEVYDNSGEMIFFDTLERCPEFTNLEGPLYELTWGLGTFAWKSIYFNVEAGSKSSVYDRPFYLANGVVASVTTKDDSTSILLVDLYESSVIYDVSADYLNESTSYIIEYVDDTHVSVTYYTENGSKENKEILEVPSLSGSDESTSLYLTEEPQAPKQPATSSPKIESIPDSVSKEQGDDTEKSGIAPILDQIVSQEQEEKDEEILPVTAEIPSSNDENTSVFEPVEIKAFELDNEITIPYESLW